MESSLSLEETNKIRVSLGLKPLVDDGAPVDVKEKAAEDNYAERKGQEQAGQRRSQLKARLDKKKNQRELNRRLVGATLGEAEGAEGDTLTWVRKSKKREKKLAMQRQQELDNLDKIYQGEYSEKDIAGLKVSHDLDALQEGEDRILTLKDSRILDNEEDELQNVDLAESERDKRRHELKTARRDYTGYDDEEFAANAVPGTKRPVLAKYDEDIDGPRQTGFRLGEVVSRKLEGHTNGGDALTPVNRALLSIDYSKNQEMSDYMQEGDVGFKKPKTKKKRSARRQTESSDLVDAGLPTINGTQNMDVDVKPVIPNMDANFIDDDELQAALEQTRRRKLSKARIPKAEEIAERVAQQRKAEREAQDLAADTPEASASKPGALEFDDTSEFVRSITYNPPAPAVVKSESIIVKVDTRAAQPEEDGDEEMGGDEVITETDADVKEEGEEDETAAMLNAIEDAIKKSEADAQGKAHAADAEDATIGTSTQQNFSRGVAATLNILRQQGLLQTSTTEKMDREQTQKGRDAWLAEYRHRLAQRELDRLRSRNSSNSKDQAQREWENRQREATEARQSMELFADYRPDVEIKYHDENGRVLTTKEAWKALSHKFHGKGSGRMKTEKRLKKIAEEKKRDAMSSGDTPLSMQAAFQIRQERAGQAHMVLSVGNRGAVPQATEFLDAPLTKKSGKARKKDVTKKEQVSDITGFTTNSSMPVLGADTVVPISPGASGAVISGEPTVAMSVPGSPAPKWGFTRIGGDVSAPGSAPGTPAPEDRGKVQFGFSAIGKRKAEDALGGPTPKQR